MTKPVENTSLDLELLVGMIYETSKQKNVRKDYFVEKYPVKIQTRNDNDGTEEGIQPPTIRKQLDARSYDQACTEIVIIIGLV